MKKKLLLLIIITTITVVTLIYTIHLNEEYKRQIGNKNMTIIMESDDYLFFVELFINDVDISKKDMEFIINTTKSYENLVNSIIFANNYNSNLNNNIKIILKVLATIKSTTNMLMDNEISLENYKKDISNSIINCKNQLIISGDYKDYIK